MPSCQAPCPRLRVPAASSDLTRTSGLLQPSLERLIISSSLPDTPENITFSMSLTIVKPSNKLVILGCVAGLLATSVLLVALYARAFLCESRTLPSSPHPVRLQLAHLRCPRC